MNDKTKYYVLLVDLHQKGYITTRALIEELGLDYEKEIQDARKRLN